MELGEMCARGRIVVAYQVWCYKCYIHHMSHVTCVIYVTYLLRVKCDGLHAPHVSDVEETNHRVACHMCYKRYMCHMLHMYVTCYM